MEGWIKLHRKFTEWEWFNISEMVHLFIYLLLNANHEESSWRGMSVKRGQIITGRSSLSENTGISVQSIRTCLNRLKSTNEITIKITNKYSIITICKYDDYQAINNSINQQINQQANQQLTSYQPTTNQQLTTNKNKENIKNDNNDKNLNIENRTQKFKESVFDFKNLYEENLLNDFFNYWTEKNIAGSKLRYEKESVFEISKRLNTWKRNEDKFKTNGNNFKSNNRDLKAKNSDWD